MGLFKRSYVEKLRDLENRLHEVSLTEDNLILKFREKVTEIEEYDIECIRLIKKLAREGHLSEKFKRALLNQLIVLLRRLEKLKFENKEQLEEMKKELEEIITTELTAESIGVNVNMPIYHGTFVSEIKEFDITLQRILSDVGTTLGPGLYCVDNKKMAINYAFFRESGHKDLHSEQLIEKRRIKPTVYTVVLKNGSNYIADLNDPVKIRAIYRDLKEFCQKQTHSDPRVANQLIAFANFLEFVLRENDLFRNIRRLLMPGTRPPEKGKYKSFEPYYDYMDFYVKKFLQSIGYHGLRCEEMGEGSKSIFPWEPSMTYTIFDPNYIKIIKEEHFALKNGRVIQIK